MKKKQHNSVRASALQITLALGLISLSAILFASSLTSSPGGANASSTTAIQPDTPGHLLICDGMNSRQSGCLCLPPDTDGDVGPNHYVQSVNSSIKIFDKNGNPLNGPNGTTYNSFFVTLVGTPCSGFNDGDGFVFYEHVADRWVVSDFAFPGTLPGAGPFYQCIGVSQTSDPVSGGWFLYAIQAYPA